MTDHANELRRYAKKLDGAPCSGDTRTVMRLAAAHIEELERRLRDAEARVTVTTDESGRAVAVTRQDDEHRILSVIWEAPVTAPVRLTDRDKDDLAAPYSGMGGIEDYRAYAQDIETAALRANGFDIQAQEGK